MAIKEYYVAGLKRVRIMGGGLGIRIRGGLNLMRQRGGRERWVKEDKAVVTTLSSHMEQQDAKIQ